MASFFKKYKFEIDIAMVGLGILLSVLYWYDVFENDKKWKWVGAIVFSILTVIKFVDVVEDYRNKKNSKQGEQRTER